MQTSKLRIIALLCFFFGATLARIFHTDSAAACENLMDTASASNCSSGSMKHTAVVAIHHLPCLDQDSRHLATNQYEICGPVVCHGTDAVTLWNSLNTKQHIALNEGKQVLVTENIQDVSWPCFHIYRLVHATPTQVTAVFWDFGNAPHFIPHCLKVTLDNYPVSNIKEVNYELAIPLLSNEVSKVLNILQSLTHDGGYEISWTVLCSKYSKSGKGSLLVVPHEKETLICYSNFVDPGSIIATLLRGYAEKQLQQIVEALVRQIEYEVQKNPQELSIQEQELKKALE